MIPGGAVILDFLIWLRSTSLSHYFFTFVGSGWPIRRWRDSELEIGMASCHKRWGKVAWAVSSWEEEMKRTRRPAGVSRAAAVGSVWAKRSTARRVTRSKVRGGRASARGVFISMSVNGRARGASRGEGGFLWWGLINLREIFLGVGFLG